MRIFAILLGLSCGLFVGLTNAASISDTTLLLGGKFTVTEDEVANSIAGLAEELNLKGPPPVDSIKKIAKDILKMKAMAAEAESRGLNFEPQIQERLEAARRQVMRDALVQSIEAQIQVPDQEAVARDYYDSHPEKFRTLSRAKFSHILFRDDPADPAADASGLRHRAQANYQEILKRIEGGESFAVLAREYSQDQGTASRGGYLGDWTTGENLDRRFAAAAFALGPGQISELVETRYGFHIIRMDDFIPESVQPYEAVKSGLIKKLRDDFVRSKVIEALMSYDEMANAAQWNEAALMRFTKAQVSPPDAGKLNSRGPEEGQP